MTESRDAVVARREAFAGVSPITEPMIRDVVHGFYGRIRQDPTLGPIFHRVIAEGDWPSHLAKMCDFWSSVTLMTGRFKGAPMQAHGRIEELGPEHFGLWLALFEETAREVCPPDAAAIFIAKSRMIARSLLMGLELARGGLAGAVAV